MLADEPSDSSALLAQVGVDRARLANRVEANLQRMRSGNSARPVFAESLFQWLEDAWVVASVERGAVFLRSGELLLQFLLRRDRYTSEAYPELDAASVEGVARALDEVIGTTPEAMEVGAASASSPGKAGPAGQNAAGAGGEALKKFGISFTEKARAKEIDPIFGRHREIRQMVDILARRRKNNPIIVGEPGVGKTALVEGLALAIAQGDVPDSLRDVELIGLDLGQLQAGAGVRGEFENRLKSVINEVKASPKPIILFIDEAHTLIGAGGTAGGSDAANLLKPALARGELRTIAATTWSEYKKYFEKDAALERRFQPVKVDEPSEADAVLMLRGLCPTYEKAHGVAIRDEAVAAAVRLSHRYLSGRQLPDKAVDVLDTAAARVKIELASRPDDLVGLEAQLAGLEQERLSKSKDAGGAAADKELDDKIQACRDSLDSLNGRWEKERALVKALVAAKEAQKKSAEGKETAARADAVAEAQKALSQHQGEEPLIHAEVDGHVVAKVIQSWTGIPVGKMRAEALDAALNLETRLKERVRGQDAAIQTVAEVVRMAYAGIRNPTTPVGVLLFVGPSGVGKTETALALADALYGGERFMTTINMSEFQEKHTVSRLIGSPPGYVGFGEGGMLTEAVRQRPYSVVLLDECEKADPEVLNLFYQVFDKGVLTDGEGRSIDFKNTVVILTSNLASDLVMKAFDDEVPPTSEEVLKEIRPTLSKHFKPALLARMTVVPYGPVSRDILKDIARMKLAALEQRLWASHKIRTSFAPEVVDELARRCTEAETGARNVEHVLRGSLMPILARDLLQRMTEGDVLNRLDVSLDDGAWRFQFA
jgi:type VI secretion system protein VasG